MACQSRFSTRDLGATQLPPTQTVFESARYAGALTAPIPPVGQKVTCGKGPPIDCNAGTPPEASAGKNFCIRYPRSIRRITSEAVAAPGNKGMSLSSQACKRLSVAPGDTPNAAPASLAARTSCPLSRVPAPTVAPIAAPTAAPRPAQRTSRGLPMQKPVSDIKRVRPSGRTVELGHAGRVRRVPRVEAVEHHAAVVVPAPRQRAVDAAAQQLPQPAQGWEARCRTLPGFAEEAALDSPPAPQSAPGSAPAPADAALLMPRR